MDEHVLAREQRAATTRPERVSFLSAPLLLSSSPLPFCHYEERWRELEKIEKPREGEEEEDQTHPLLLLPHFLFLHQIDIRRRWSQTPTPTAIPLPLLLLPLSLL